MIRLCLSFLSWPRALEIIRAFVLLRHSMGATAGLSRDGVVPNDSGLSKGSWTLWNKSCSRGFGRSLLLTVEPLVWVANCLGSMRAADPSWSAWVDTLWALAHAS